LYELQYLIAMKKVRYLVLNRSYFLREEIDELLDTEEGEQKMEINPFRFVLVDLLQNKKFEFTPFSFNLEEIIKKKDEDLLEIERIYIY